MSTNLVLNLALSSVQHFCSGYVSKSLALMQVINWEVLIVHLLKMSLNSPVVSSLIYQRKLSNIHQLLHHKFDESINRNY